MNRHIRQALAALTATAALVGAAATPAAARALPSYFEVVNRHSNQCLEIAEGRTASGTWAQQWPCSGVPHQRWHIQLYPPSNLIEVTHTGFCLTALGGYAFQLPCNGSVNQNWDKQTPAGNVGMEFRSALNGHCLQVENMSTVNGELVGLAACTGRANQQWWLR